MKNFLNLSDNLFASNISSRNCPKKLVVSVSEAAGNKKPEWTTGDETPASVAVKDTVIRQSDTQYCSSVHFS